MTNVLVVTTSVRVLNGVHRDTSNVGPVLSLRLGLVVAVSSLQHGLVDSSTSSNDSNHSSALGVKSLSLSGRKSDSSSGSVLGVADDDGSGSRSSGELSSVSEVSLEVAHDGSFGESVERKDVSYAEISFGSSIDELAGVHALNGDEVLSSSLVSERVSEADDGKRSASSRLVNDLLDDASEVSLSLGVVEDSELSGSDSMRGVGLENGRSTLSLGWGYVTYL